MIIIFLYISQYTPTPIYSVKVSWQWIVQTGDVFTAMICSYARLSGYYTYWFDWFKAKKQESKKNQISRNPNRIRQTHRGLYLCWYFLSEVARRSR